MEKTRYFRSSNRLNVIVNILSGHLFPLDDADKRLSFLSILWIICMWAVKIIYFWTGVLGSLHFADLTSEDRFKQFGAIAMLIAESLIPTIHLHLRRKELVNLINEYNRTLIDSEHLRRCVRDTIGPYRKGLTIYMIVCFIVSSAWSGAPIVRVFNEDSFAYKDFAVPAYVPGAPFDKKVLVAGAIFQIFGSCSYHFAKISVDVYVIQFIAVLAAQYKFVGEELCRALRDENGKKDDSWVVAALHQCVQYHGAIIQYSSLYQAL